MLGAGGSRLLHERGSQLVTSACFVALPAELLLCKASGRL